MANRKFIRTIALSDTHCGSLVGLTPSEYTPPTSLYPYRERRDELWDLFQENVAMLKPFDVALVVGDLVHGPTVPRKNHETITTDANTQKNIAIRVLEFIGAPKGVIVHGTPWHVGEEFIEQEIADAMGYEFHKQIDDYPVDKVLFNLKHKVGGGSMPHTIGNTLNNEVMAALRNGHKYGIQIADIFLRAHKHIFHERGGLGWAAYILPSLQAWGGLITVEMTAAEYPDMGFLVFDIYPDKEWSCEKVLFTLKSQLKSSKKKSRMVF